MASKKAKKAAGAQAPVAAIDADKAMLREFIETCSDKELASLSSHAIRTAPSVAKLIRAVWFVMIALSPAEAAKAVSGVSK